MSYYRVYPNKNNTIFKDNLGSALVTTGNINTGQNPLLELRDGNSQTKIVFGFDISNIKDILTKYSYTCNFKLYDAGVIYEPVLKDLKTIDLFYFTEDFVEGDGFSFLEGEAIEGLSNWNYRTFGNDWAGCFVDGVPNAFQLNSTTDDIIIPGLQSFIANAITLDKNPNFALSLHSNTPDVNTYTKFIYGRRTRTIFTPYLEFFINDEIIDLRRNTIATKETTLYLINHNKEDFTGVVTCRVLDESDISAYTPSVVNLGNGIYRIKFTPVIAYSNTVLRDVWSIDGVDIFKGMIEIVSPNKIVEENYENMYFYPVTQYTHPLVRIGDIIKFDLVSEQRRQGSKIIPLYEFKIVSTNGFEMQPWTSVNLYKDKLFFKVDTSYYFPELEYEVFVRLNTNEFTRTGLNTYKFRATGDWATHLADRATNPYNNRDYMAK